MDKEENRGEYTARRILNKSRRIGESDGKDVGKEEVSDEGRYK